MGYRPADSATRRRLVAIIVGMMTAAVLGWLIAARETAVGDPPDVAAVPTSTSTAVSSTAVSSTAEPSTAVSSTAMSGMGPEEAGGESSTTLEDPTGAELERDDVYRWLWADAGDVRLVWRDDNGEPFNQLERARGALERAGNRVVAIMNGGIYRPDLVPSGLYVEDGVELRPLKPRQRAAATSSCSRTGFSGSPQARRVSTRPIGTRGCRTTVARWTSRSRAARCWWSTP